MVYSLIKYQILDSFEFLYPAVYKFINSNNSIASLLTSLLWEVLATQFSMLLFILLLLFFNKHLAFHFSNFTPHNLVHFYYFQSHFSVSRF